MREVKLNADASPGGEAVVTHWYGYDGERVKTAYDSNASGLSSYGIQDEWRFGPGLVVRGDDVEVVVSLGSRAVARLEVDYSASGGGAVHWMHQTFGPGPSLISDSSGAVTQDRMFAPFGTMLKVNEGSGVSWDVDRKLMSEPLSWVNKEVERATTWSDHGARWYASRTGRWLSPDPPVKGPGENFLVMPWDAHPYQYGGQSPVVFWDPDGRSSRKAAEKFVQTQMARGKIQIDAQLNGLQRQPNTQGGQPTHTVVRTPQVVVGFRVRVEQALVEIAMTREGRSILESIDKSGRVVDIRPASIAPGVGPAMTFVANKNRTTANDPKDLTSARQGRGTNAIVFLQTPVTPSKFETGKGPRTAQQRDVVQHELRHALSIARGNLEDQKPANSTRTVKGQLLRRFINREEEKAVESTNKSRRERGEALRTTSGVLR